MLSFRLKIVVSLVALSLISFALGAYNTRYVLLDLFENVMIDRSAEGFRYDVSAYYHTYGSWDAALAAEDFEQFRLRAGRSAGRPAPHRSFGDPPSFIATDLDGKVRIPGENKEYVMGVTIPAKILTEESVPLRSRGTAIGYAIAEGEMLPTEIEERYLQGLRNTWWVSLLLVAGVSIPLGYFLGGRLTKPINNLMAAISNMNPSNLDQKVPVNSKDELGMLSLSFNQMSTDLADFVKVVKNQKEKISQTEQLLREGLINISHELRTPLYTSISQAQAMLDGIRPLDKNQLEKVSGSLEHLSHLVDDLHFLSLSDVKSLRYEFELVDLSEIIKECVDAKAEIFAERQLTLTLKLPETCELDGDKTRLRQIVDNLLSNCHRYSDQGANVEVELIKESNSVDLLISDSGPGVHSEHLEFLFDRFYKGDHDEKHASEGLGLGLSIVKTCAEIHGGQVEAFSNEKGGLGIRVSLPISDSHLPKST